MRNVTRTAYGAYIQTNQLFGISPRFHPFTTLNEALGILDTEVPVAGQVPKLEYFCIGIGGHRLGAGADGRPMIKEEPHDTTDAGLYEQIPFVLREPGADLDEVSRRDYCLRKLVNDPQGNPFIAYYGRRINLEGLEVQWEQRTLDENGTIIDSQPFIPDSSNLNPTPRSLSNTGVNTINGQHIVVGCRITLGFNRAQIDELLNVCRILYGDEDYAVISEIGFVTGVNRVIQATAPGQGTFNFNEVIGAQIMSHMIVNYPANHANNRIDIAVEVGAQEPLLKFTPVNP